MTDSLTEGRALVKAIAGLLALNDAGVDIDSAETGERLDLLKTYQQRLRNLIVSVSPEMANSILAGEVDVLPGAFKPN